MKSVAPDYTFSLEIIKTIGDIDQHSSLSSLGGTGIFVKEIEKRLTSGDIDMAVHSAKDLPSELSEQFCLAAIPKRGPVEDVLVSRLNKRLDQFSPGEKIATGSPRRRALVKSFNPQPTIVEVRGNVDTRLRKLADGEYDGIILAKAGLIRLGLEARITQILPPETFIPAAGQGALAVETCSDNEEIIDVVSKIDSKPDHQAVAAERRFLQTLRAGCSTPVGAWARWENRHLKMNTIILDPEGGRILRATDSIYEGNDVATLGEKLAEYLLSLGARELLSHEN